MSPRHGSFLVVDRAVIYRPTRGDPPAWGLGVGLCCFVGGYQCFGEKYQLHLQCRSQDICSFQTLVAAYMPTRRHNPEDHNRYLLSCKNLKSQISLVVFIVAYVPYITLYFWWLLIYTVDGTGTLEITSSKF
jgi:hypothetical protein